MTWLKWLVFCILALLQAWEAWLVFHTQVTSQAQSKATWTAESLVSPSKAAPTSCGRKESRSERKSYAG